MYQCCRDFSSVRGEASAHLVTSGEGLLSTLMMSSKWWGEHARLSFCGQQKQALADARSLHTSVATPFTAHQ